MRRNLLRFKGLAVAIKKREKKTVYQFSVCERVRSSEQNLAIPPKGVFGQGVQFYSSLQPPPAPPCSQSQQSPSPSPSNYSGERFVLGVGWGAALRVRSNSQNPRDTWGFHTATAVRTWCTVLPPSMRSTVGMTKILSFSVRYGHFSASILQNCSSCYGRDVTEGKLHTAHRVKTASKLAPKRLTDLRPIGSVLLLARGR